MRDDKSLRPFSLASLAQDHLLLDEILARLKDVDMEALGDLSFEGGELLARPGDVGPALNPQVGEAPGSQERPERRMEDLVDQ